jgi:hypothetical protein
VVRSEADQLIFQHAGKSAKTFDCVKVETIEFANANGTTNGAQTNGTDRHHTNGSTNGATNGATNGTANGTAKISNPGRPISASYKRKDDGATGTIRFDYIVDASGRAGVLSTKYMKNRHYNASLKNVANWAYFEGTGSYDNDPKHPNTPFFEALNGEPINFLSRIQED